MNATAIRERIGRLILDEAHAVSRSYYPHSKIDTIVFYINISCFCKFVNVKMQLDRTSKYDSKDFGDDFIAEGIDAFLPLFDDLYESEDAALAPAKLDGFIDHSMSVLDTDIITRLAYSHHWILKRTYSNLDIKPDRLFDYESSYMDVSRFSQSLFKLIRQIN